MGSETPDPRSIAQALASQPALERVLASLGHAASEAYGRGDRSFPRGTAGLDRAECETPYGNVAEICERGPSTAVEATLLAVLLALANAERFPSAPETELTHARELAWVGLSTRVNALSVVDDVLGEERLRPLWRAVAALAEPSKAEDPAIATAALFALSLSGSEAARSARDDLASRSDDALVRRALGRPAPEPTDARLSGELGPTPRGPIATTLLACTGLLLLSRGARLLGRFGLAYRQPAEVRLSPRGLELSHRTELLGRVLRQRETVIPLANLAKVTREVRYPRLGLYLGLLALALGSYVGMGLLVDGARVPGGSFPMLGMGLLVIALGLGIDYGLSVVSDEVRGRCRLVVEPKKGKRLCIGALDPTRADAMLAALATRTTR